jgi:predicted RNA-binding protein YlqC (UPF0109 family)
MTEAESANRAPAPTAATVLEFVVTQLVDDPQALSIEAVPRRRAVDLEVRVAPGEMGRLIGRRGRTAQAIRSVVRAAAVRDSIDVNVEFVD